MRKHHGGHNKLNAFAINNQQSVDINIYMQKRDARILLHKHYQSNTCVYMTRYHILDYSSGRLIADVNQTNWLRNTSRKRSENNESKLKLQHTDVPDAHVTRLFIYDGFSLQLLNVEEAG